MPNHFSRPGSTGILTDYNGSGDSDVTYAMLLLCEGDARQQFFYNSCITSLEPGLHKTVTLITEMYVSSRVFLVTGWFEVRRAHGNFQLSFAYKSKD